MFTRNPLAAAIAATVTGMTLTLGGMSSASAADTMYNLYNANVNGFGPGGNALPCAPCKGPANNVNSFTDGWVWGLPNPLTFQGAVSGGNPNAATPGWVGTGGPTTTPFNYVSAHSLNWGIHLTSATDSGQISNADAIARYNVSADIDTAKGAWFDNASPSGQGWKHDLDLGLFKSDVTTSVKLRVDGVNLADTNYGITVFKGMSSNETLGYVHHGAWNTSQNGTPAIGEIDTFGTGDDVLFTGADIVATTDTSGPTPVNLNELVFLAQAGQVYTIAIGGWRDGSWGVTNDGYVASFAAVPIPAGVWLLGSAFAGLAGLRRRQA